MSEILDEVRDTLKESTEVRALSIVTDEKELRKPNTRVNDVSEAADIAEKLWVTLSARGEGDVGLAAPQIGIHKKVCVIRAKTPIVLVNPTIVEKDGETWYQEGCVSFLGVSIRTKRHKNIVVEVDWLGEHNGLTIEWMEKQTLYFAAEDIPKMEDDMGLLESVAVQHECDHCEGILFFDREWKLEPVRNEKKVGRNEPCPCGNQKKYKKCCEKL